MENKEKSDSNLNEEEFLQQKLKEVKAKAANKIIRKTGAPGQKPKMNEQQKKKEAAARLVRIEKMAKANKEEISHDAASYIMALIKRDSKPSNPETAIMIKLFEKMSEVKSRVRHFDHMRLVLKYRLEEIRRESDARGIHLDSEIDEASKPALRMLNQAFKAIEAEEKNT